MKKRDDIYLREIESRIQKIASHLKKITLSKFLKSDLHRSAIIRELEVIGEAAGKVSPETKKQFNSIPWEQMVGMRNRLIHGYGDVDYSIVWEVAKNETPMLEKSIRQAILETAPSAHPWRICPAGYYHVRKHPRAVSPTASHPDGITSVRQHCRRNPTDKDQLYPEEIFEIFERASSEIHSLGKIGKLAKDSSNKFDTEILVWTKYWNDIFEPSQPLDPNVVKALLGSESTFGENAKDVFVRKGNYARGPFQITDETRKILSNERGEITNHYLTVTAKEVKDPIIGANVAVRWLFQKKKLASSFLKREATWDEAVADYKSYLRRKKPFAEQKGMEAYYSFLKQLKEGK